MLESNIDTAESVLHWCQCISECLGVLSPDALEHSRCKCAISKVDALLQINQRNKHGHIDLYLKKPLL